jgi:lysyl-tRNA synthetase class 2
MRNARTSRALTRRFAGEWLGAIVAFAGWIVAGPAVTAAAVAVALIVSPAAWRPRRLERARAEGARRRLELLSAPAAGLAWAAAASAELWAPVTGALRAGRVLHPLAGASAALALAHVHVVAPWEVVVDLLVGGALVCSLLAARALSRPDRLGGETSQAALDRARAIVLDHGDDSLAPYILRPDKTFQFAGDGVVAYAVVGETVVISADPVGPPAAAAEALGTLVERAHRAGLRVAAYGVSDRHLARFADLGLRAVRAGEEAVVDPRRFTLEGRPVRKLRQSVHRLQRRGWQVTIHDGREIDAELEAAIGAVEAQWRADRARITGFAMSMGEFELAIRPDDLYVLAWSPNGRLQAVMRFLTLRRKLSLDIIRRVGQPPNGVTEALVCHALEVARDRGVEEVSLNYAGLSHLLRDEAPGGRFGRALAGQLLRPLSGRFQMDRLVLFNEKFSPDWRPRYLVYESPVALPRTIFRVLQAEGYLAHRSAVPQPASRRRPLVSSTATVEGRTGR